MEILCSLDNIQFPITKYEIKNKEIKLEILFDTNKYKGVFEQLEIKCIPLLFDKYKDTILQLKIYSDISHGFRKISETSFFFFFKNYERSELDSCAAYERV